MAIKTITIKDVLSVEEEREVKDGFLMHDSRKIWTDAVPDAG